MGSKCLKIWVLNSFEEARKNLLFSSVMCIFEPMSKRALKKYLDQLKKPDLEEQLIDLYMRFPEVKKYYDFVFNPKEDKLLQEAKTKISNEYFPLKRRRPRARRSVAQKYIKHFKTLGVDSYLLSDLMLFNLETAQRYSKRHTVNDAFYKSMLNSFNELITHTAIHGLLAEFKNRIIKVFTFLTDRNWSFQEEFQRTLDKVDLLD